MRIRLPGLLLLAALAPANAQLPAKPRRALTANDLYRLRTVSDPRVSPEGAWVAYTVSTPDSTKDKSDSDVWMSSWDGETTLRVTSSPDGESKPRFSPDGRWLAFTSGRQEGKGAQLWLLDRRGGEAERVSQVKGGVTDYAWSPDSKRIVLVVDEDIDSIARKDSAEHKTPKPIVIDRYQFKQDISGYLGSSRSHLALFDVSSHRVQTLVDGVRDDDAPVWSPDGRRIAYVSRPIAEPGKTFDADVYVIDAVAGAAPRALTDFAGPDEGPLAWSPDGKWIAFVRGDEPKFYAYHTLRLALVAADGSGAVRVVSDKLDRGVEVVSFGEDGASVMVLVTDDRSRVLGRVRLSDGALSMVIAGSQVIGAASVAPGHIAVLSSTAETPYEVYAVERGTLRPLSQQNRPLMSQVRLAVTSGFSSKSKDGTEVHGMIMRPADVQGPLPTLLIIHGGPKGQDGWEFSLPKQVYVANGYQVLSVNYRGSDGRGSAYQKAIFADWGNKEVMDLLGAVDEAVRSGVADPNHLGIGGWSYGGILTDYTIGTTPRFKAAVSGAGSALWYGIYGTDEYIPQYDLELGAPWKNKALWDKLSWPFFQAEKITTPTLFMGGQSDFNVPIMGGEQMYQALRTLGVSTQLVIYPSQFHGLTVPSYLVDRMNRYVAWYDRYVKAGSK
ncbi:MAG: WD40-like beta Propeller containing protein [Gemmatimonadetes bacterium]|nr:WD40-like beta Propeller containing protein [Gemmatimonadota bacterium]